MTELLRRAAPHALLLALAAAAGCARPQAGPPPAGPPKVFVAEPVTQDVTDYEEFTGRTEAYLYVDVRARVTGHLKEVLFVDGSVVKKDDPLFEINPELYQAELEQASGVVRQTEARLKQLQADYRRARMAGAGVSKQDYDKAAADMLDAEANIKVALAKQKIARINRGYCTVHAPFGGRISRKLTDPGNLVKADDTILTTIVNLDTIYVYFDVDERTLTRIRRLAERGRLGEFTHQITQILGGQSLAPLAGPAAPLAQALVANAAVEARAFALGSIVIHDKKVSVQMGLADEPGYPRKLDIDFEDNRVDAATGTLRMRGRLPNPTRLISPGMFVRIRLPINRPTQAILVAEQALGTDQGQKYVYVVNDKDEVVYRQVEVGRVHDGMRAITHGLKSGERVVVSGLQRVRQGAKVKPTLVKMREVARKPKALPVARGLEKSEIRNQKSEQTKKHK